MKYTLAITTYNRPKMTIEAFRKVAEDPRIGEIVIVDDHSTTEKYDQLIKLVQPFKRTTIKVFRNDYNVGMMENKKRAVDLSISDWVILFDSDNVITPEYLDAIPERNLKPNVIFCPDFARPHFDYTAFSNTTVDRHSVKRIMKQRMGEALMNTCNYLVHRDTYLKVWKWDGMVKATDTISFACQWLESGNVFRVVKGMQYHHLVHDGSGFLEDAKYNMEKAEFYKSKIISL